MKSFCACNIGFRNKIIAVLNAIMFMTYACYAIYLGSSTRRSSVHSQTFLMLKHCLKNTVLGKVDC